MDTAVKTTPLHAWHVGKNANMAAFGGYEMPLWYPSGAKAEHLAAITSAGLFDTSHMAVLTLHGPAVRALLQRAFSTRCSSGSRGLQVGQCAASGHTDTCAGTELVDIICCMHAHARTRARTHTHTHRSMLARAGGSR